MAFTLKTHKWETSNVRSYISKVKPYIRISKKDEIPLFIQEGKVYSEDGALQKEIPDWFTEEVNKLDDKSLRAVGVKKSDFVMEDNSGNDQPDKQMAV